VVVKNVGQQIGVWRASRRDILGNGEIVLIINPVQLIARAPSRIRRTARPKPPPTRPAARANGWKRPTPAPTRARS